MMTDEDASLALGHKPGELAFVQPYDASKDNGSLASRKGPPVPGAAPAPARLKVAKPETGQVASGPMKDDASLNAGFGGNGAPPFMRGLIDDPNSTMGGAAGMKKAKSATGPVMVQLTEVNWMLEYARNAREANAVLGEMRKSLAGEVRLDLDREEGEQEYWMEGDEYGVGEEEAEQKQAIQVQRAAMKVKLRMADNGDDDEDQEEDEEAEEAAITDAMRLVSPIKRDNARQVGAPPTKRRRIFNPIRGIIEPETNSPLVYASTQATRATMKRISGIPRIDQSGTSLSYEPHFAGSNEKEMEERLRLGLKARKLGMASIELVVGDRSFADDSMIDASTEF